MKNLNLFILLLIFGISSYSTAQNVNIPDANFKAALVANSAINTNMDSEIQVSEAVAFTGAISLSNQNIADLTGIEAFTALTTLDLSNNQLTTLDVSANTALTHLYCMNNQLTNLDISANTALIEFYCTNNQITTINLSTNTALTTLDLTNNLLNTLDISANTALTVLFCSGNQLPTLDVSTNTALTSLHCFDNLLTTLDVSANTALDVLNCYTNQLTALDVSNNTALTVLRCNANQLTTLDVSVNAALTSLNCNDNQLTALDASANTALIVLVCNNNQLGTLNVKNGNNVMMTNNFFRAQNNPNLLCIEVDSVAYSNANWLNKDATASYSTNCLLNTTTLSGETTNITTYPNPTNSNVQINLGKTYATATVELRNIMGQTISSNTYNNANQVEMNIEGAAGLYFVNIRTEEGEVVVKVVKE